MKKGIGIVLGCLLAGGAAFAQKITVLSPNGGESWEAGKSQNITWEHSGIPADKTVKIMLWKEGVKVGDIANNVPIGGSGSGTYAWTVGVYIGGTVAPDAPEAGYKIRVRDQNNQYDYDGSNLPFTITPASGTPGEPGGLKIPWRGPVAGQIPISITEPTKTSVWTIGETHTIRWHAVDKVNYPLSIFLVSADHKIPIVDIGKSVALGNLRPMEKSWKVTDNLYDQQYCIRITSADQAYSQHSATFTIKATKTTNHEVAPSWVANKGSWYDITKTNALFTEKKLASIPDPGGKIIKYGYQRWYEDSDNYGWILHRSYVFFDLAEVISKLIGPATVKSASIHWEKAANSPQACFSVIWCLDGAMAVGNGSPMFGAAFDGFPKHKVNGSSQLLAQMAQRWLADPSKNYGVVICAAVEGSVGQNGQCVQFGDPVILKLTIDEKLTK